MNVNDPERWRARLRLAIERSGLKQSVVARRAHIAPETLSRILNASSVHPAFETIVRIAGATGVRVGWLLEERVRGVELSQSERGVLREAAGILSRIGEER